MKRLICVMLVGLVIFLSGYSIKTNNNQTQEVVYNPFQENDSLQLVSYNIAGNEGSYPQGNHCTKRIILFSQQMKKINPDVMGTQETTLLWVNQLERLMPEYSCYWICNDKETMTNNCEVNAIFYLKDKYNVIESGKLWLSQTPETKPKDNDKSLIWLVLENKHNGNRYIIMNTQLDNSSDEIFETGLSVVENQYQSLCDKYPDIPVIMAGGFEKDLSSTNLLSCCNDLKDTRSVATKTDYTSTYNGWEGSYKDKTSSDYILTNSKEISVQEFSVIKNESKNYMISDHNGLLIKCESNSQGSVSS